jgi:hypothetical protein
VISLSSLNLWQDEEKRILQCLVDALEELIHSNNVSINDDELNVSGKFRPILRKHRKSHGLNWILQFEASVFKGEEDPRPFGHPDIQFSRLDADGEQWDYDVECKLIRILRPSKNWSYSEHYVIDGVNRFHSLKYCVKVFSGAMIGYVQEGDLSALLMEVNEFNKTEGLYSLQKQGVWQLGGITRFTQVLNRKSPKDFSLIHLWADLRINMCP